MRLAISTIAYHEERFIPKFIQHYQNKVNEIVVLASTKPWNGEHEDNDHTPAIARSLGATVIEHDWSSEEEQRNAGQEYLSDYDWVIVLDPDEYIDDVTWGKLLNHLETAEAEALIVGGQYTMWKSGYVADPPKDYPMLIAAKPTVRFVDKRVVGSPYAQLPDVWLYHFSWAKTDDEVWRKISHYAHASDFDIKDWFENVWKKWKPGMTDVHPVSPETLHKLVPATLPKEIEKLELWP